MSTRLSEIEKRLRELEEAVREVLARHGVKWG